MKRNEIIFFFFLFSCSFCFLVRGKERRERRNRERELERELEREMEREREKDLKIAFLKTHKTGSSTIASILLRLGVNRELNIPLYGFGTERRNGRTYEIDSPLSSEVLQLKGTTRKGGLPFDIWPHHVLFKEGLESARLVIPGVNRIDTIIRNPAQRWASSLCYYWNRCNLMGLAFSKEVPPEIEAVALEMIGRKRRNEPNVKQRVEKLVQHLQSEGPWEYHVMVLERLPESLALFSLDYDLHPLEVAYLPMKISMKKSQRTELTLEYLSKLQPLETALYNAANIQLNSRINLYPHSLFEQRLADIQGNQTLLQTKCDELNGKRKPFQTFPSVTRGKYQGEYQVDWEWECFLARLDHPEWMGWAVDRHSWSLSDLNQTIYPQEKSVGSVLESNFRAGKGFIKTLFA